MRASCSILCLSEALYCVSGDLSVSEGLSGEASKRLKVFRSDPFDYHSIVDAVKGCSGLFYNFEPPMDHPTYDVSC